MKEEERPQSGFDIPASLDDYLAYGAKSSGVSEDRLRSATDNSNATRSELLDVIWMQSTQNMALLEALVALAGDNQLAKTTRVAEAVEATRGVFAKMAKLSGKTLHLSMVEANERAQGQSDGG